MALTAFVGRFVSEVDDTDGTLLANVEGGPMDLVMGAVGNKTCRIFVSPGVHKEMDESCGEDLEDVMECEPVLHGMLNGHFEVTDFQDLDTPLNQVVYPHLELAAALVTNGLGPDGFMEWSDAVDRFEGRAFWQGTLIVTVAKTFVLVYGGDEREVCTTCRLAESQGVVILDVRMRSEV